MPRRLSWALEDDDNFRGIRFAMMAATAPLVLDARSWLIVSLAYVATVRVPTLSLWRHHRPIRHLLPFRTKARKIRESASKARWAPTAVPSALLADLNPIEKPFSNFADAPAEVLPKIRRSRSGPASATSSAHFPAEYRTWNDYFIAAGYEPT